jgi:hypothetical protein
MKKHHILLSLEKPNYAKLIPNSREYPKENVWKDILSGLTNKAKSNADVVVLAGSDEERAFLILLAGERTAGLVFAGDCISRTENYGGSVKKWFLDEKVLPMSDKA